MKYKKAMYYPGVVWKWFQIKNFSIFGGEIRAVRCGHKTRKKWEVYAFGQFKEGLTISPNENNEVDYCAHCLCDMIIRCANCGGIIIPGDPIVLYKATHGFAPPEYAVSEGEGEDYRCVWCLRKGCAEKLDRNAFWVIPGKILHVHAPVEQIAVTGKFAMSDINVCDIDTIDLDKEG